MKTITLTLAIVVGLLTRSPSRRLAMASRFISLLPVLALCLGLPVHHASGQTTPILRLEIDQLRVEPSSRPITEGFDIYPAQNVAATGTEEEKFAVLLSGSSEQVASIEGFISSAGFSPAAAGGQVLHIDTIATSQNFLAIADFPGLDESLPTGGPFDVLRDANRPDFTSGFTFSATVREATGNAAAQVRFLIGDLGLSGDPNQTVEFVTPLLPLSTSFRTFTFTRDEFAPFPGESGQIDLTRIGFVSLEFVTGGPDQCVAGDADQDGDADIADVSVLRRRLVGLPANPPIGP